MLDDELSAYYKEHFVQPLAAFSEQTGLPAVVVTLPSETNSLLTEALYRPLEALFEGTNVGCRNSYPAFHALYGGRGHKKNISVNPQNVHPGSAAHRFYAEYICEFLLRDYADVLGTPADADLNSRLISVNDRMPGDIGLKTVSESETVSVYTFDYPDITVPRYLYEIEISPYCLNWPVGEDYVKLSFENPVNLSRVRITGENGQRVSLCYTRWNEALNYDDHTVKKWAADAADPTLWTSARDERATSLCIHADRPGKLTVTIEGHTEA